MLWTSLDVKMGAQLTVLTWFDKCHQMFDTCHWCWTVSVGLIWSEITAGHAPCGDSRACHSDRADHCQPAQKKNYVGTYCTLPNFTLTTWRCPWRASRMRSKLPGLYQCRSPRSWQRWQTQWQTDWKTLTKSCEQKMQQRDARCRKSLRCNSMPKMPEMFLNNKNRAKTTWKRHHRKQCRSIQNTTWDTVTQTLQPLDIKYQ